MATYGIPTKAIHDQWIGPLQPVGLVVAPAVLTKLELVPNQSTAYLSALQLQLKGLMEEVDGPKGEPVQVVPSFRQLATGLLDWSEADLLDVEALAAAAEPGTIPAVVLAEYGETLRPSHGVPKPEASDESAKSVSATPASEDAASVPAPIKLQALVLDLTQWRDASGRPDPQWGRDFDAPWNPTGHGWDATPQQRFERLLKETEHPIGILFNGSQLRLVHAPRGESSGHITFPLEPLAEVAGRPLLGGLELLLGVDRLFGGNPEQRLPQLLAASRKNQNEVSTRLAEQVLEALWELLLGFDEAERIARDAGGTVLGDLPRTEAGQKQLYGGLITVLLRLVFLLYAEDEALMPSDSLYGQHYSVSALADRLRQERVEHQGAMADRRGAWASLLSLFRLVYDGGGADPAYLPARHGELFDPDAYPFLEGRGADSSYSDGILTNLPALSDDVLEKVLSRLIWLDGERLSYRALDVEQIGSVYEGIMGFTVEQASGPSVGISYRPPRQKITITVVVDAEQLLAVSPGKREKWLDDHTGVALKLPTKVKKELKEATSLAELCVALDKKLSPHTPNALAAGSLILQPTAERRRSGSHYTPRALTEPIVAEAFRPWLERCNGQPSAEQILALKVCDPAMGSGAFLVAVCRYLAGWLVQAWEKGGYPEGFRAEWDKDNVARRLIAQRCLYGVDKNPFAVNLARLSLWLVTLSQDLPFTFVDHALKCGDSLVGYSLAEIQAATENVQLQLLRIQQGTYVQACADLRSNFSEDTLSDESYDRKRVLLQQQIKASDGLRQAGDLMVAAFFDAPKAREREDKQQVYLAMLSGAFNDEGLQDSIQEIRDRLASGDKGIRPFHWDLEFPEVFGDGRGGFNAVLGNPPFMSSTNMHSMQGEKYKVMLESLQAESSGRTVDLCAHFFRRAFQLLGADGTLSMLATNTISQGDTREAGLEKIIKEGGRIYACQKRLKWQGAAAVTTSWACVYKPSHQTALIPFKYNSYLLPAKSEAPVLSLSESKGRCLIGHQVYGEGFVLFPSATTEDERLLSALTHEPSCASFVKPYLGAKELLSSPLEACSRWVIDANQLSEEELRGIPLLHAFLSERVKPERDTLGGYSVADRRRQLWWRYGTYASGLEEALNRSEKCLVIPRVATYLCVSSQRTGCIHSDSTTVVAGGDGKWLAVLQSSLHLFWTLFRCSSLEDRIRYTPTDCFETFPFPTALLDSTANDPSHEATRQSLEAIGERYHQFRSELMVGNNEGLTSTYNRFHDPAETSSGLLQLRALHQEMDQAVLEAYGWSDALTQAISENPHHTPCGFGLDYLDLEDDLQLPEALQERIDTGDLFFWDAGDALDFQGQLRASGAVKANKRLPWRYRWPDNVRDDVLARLLALNAERYEEEVAMGLHSKGAKQAARAAGATAAAATGKRRGRPPKASQPGETGGDLSEQMGLGL